MRNRSAQIFIIMGDMHNFSLRMHMVQFSIWDKRGAPGQPEKRGAPRQPENGHAPGKENRMAESGNRAPDVPSAGKILRIGSAFLEHADGWIRLSSRIRTGSHEVVLWFGVREEEEHFLTQKRADPFVMLLLPMAMRQGYDLVCEDPVSARLLASLETELIPYLTGAGSDYRKCRITGQATALPHPSDGSVSTGFSGGVDSLYTIFTHASGSDLPLTHLSVFNTGVFEGKHYRENFLAACENCRRFALEQGLGTAFVDSNVYEILREDYIETVTYRLTAFALALQGLLSDYLISSTYPADLLRPDTKHAEMYAPLLVRAACTESLRFGLCGGETGRVGKIRTLADWEPSYRWVSPCIWTEAGKMNCGHCKKCMRDLAVLYAMGRLDDYRPVYDVDDYRKHLPERLAYVLANETDPICAEHRAFLLESGAPIPPSAFRRAEMFRKVLRAHPSGDV